MVFVPLLRTARQPLATSVNIGATVKVVRNVCLVEDVPLDTALLAGMVALVSMVGFPQEASRKAFAYCAYRNYTMHTRS